MTSSDSKHYLLNVSDLSGENQKTPKRSEPKYWNNGTHKWATIASMDFGKPIVETKEYITDAALHETHIKRVPEGTLLFSFKLTIGKMAFAGCDLYTNEAIAALTPKADLIDKRFLFYALQITDLTANAGEAAKGKTLNTKTLPRIPLIFPEDINEQQRIVSRIEALTGRTGKIQEIATSCAESLDECLQAKYSKLIDGAQWKPLNAVASLVRRAVKTRPNEKYEEMGIRSFGKGTFRKPVLTGKQIGNKRIYYIHKGDLVFNNVFAWEKAIAVAKSEDHARVGSHRFITYVPHDGKSTSEFLCHHFLSERGIEDIRAASPGSTGRNRTLGLKKLEKIKVPVPDFSEQKRFSELVQRRQLIQAERVEVSDDLKALSGSIISKAFRGEL